MKVLRTGGAYLAGQAEHHGRRHLWILAIGVCAAIIVGLAWHPLIAIAPLLWAAVRARPAYRRVARVRRGIRGEEDVTALLRRLPDDYVLVNDVMLPGGLGNIDHVVFGPCGIVVIETKRYRGLITCERGRWFQNGRRIRSVGKQANRGAMSLREYLRREHPEFARNALRWIDSIVVFTDPLCRLRIDRPGVTMVRYSELLGVMLEKGRSKRLASSTARTLAHSLVREARVRDLPA